METLPPQLQPRPAARASYPPRPGNAVRFWLDGAPALARITRAVEEARHTVRLTLAQADWRATPPGRRETLLDLLGAAARRGLDVRALCWREPQLPELDPGARCFGGDASDLAALAERAPDLRVRWDRLPEGYCHDQKCWLLDAGEAGERAFVGGPDWLPRCFSEPGYPECGSGSAHGHGLTLELAGPAVTDLHHNFVQRWNEASERAAPDGCWPDADAASPLHLPSFLSRPQGEVPVQVTRTVRADTYRDESPPPGAKPFAIAAGEQSTLEQLLSAVASAERSLYLENPTLASPIVVEEIARALVRGVRVIALVSGEAHPAFVAARRDARAQPFFDQLAGLAQHAHFTLAALCAGRGEGRYEEIAVGARLAVVDDAWATVGSTQAAVRSFRHDTGLDASLWHRDTARALREALFANALGRDAAALAGLSEREAFDAYAAVARANLDRRALWEPLEGFAYALDPAQYGA